MIYKLYITNKDMGGIKANAIMTFEFNFSKSFLFDPNNSDYQQFKRDIAEGAELQDADGNMMTEQAAQEFIRTLP